MTTAIYAIEDSVQWGPHVVYALQRLRLSCDEVIVAGDVTALAAQLAVFGDGAQPDRIIAADGMADAFRKGLSAASVDGPVLLTGAHAVGPIDVAGHLGSCGPEDVLSAYPQYLAADQNARVTSSDRALPSLDFCVLGASVAACPDIFDAFRGGGAPITSPRPCERSLAAYLHKAGALVMFIVPLGTSHSPAPAWFEPARMLAAGAPCLPAGLLNLDPLVHDVTAIDLPAAIKALHAAAPDLCAAWLEHGRRTVEPRAMATLTGSLDVVAVEPCEPNPHGPVAVFIHAWYPEALGSLLDRVAHIPALTDLFITTGSDEARAQINAHLGQRGLVAEVRVVAQNRGRDMSSLFITFADVALSGRYDVALRLHTKRSPQLAPQVSQAFRDHLLCNLLASPGYVARLLDRFTQNPRLGLVTPPAVHQGFGTLGHGWFGNRAPLEKWARRLGINIPLDSHTPVAPFGTMFWFRPAALAKMFAWPWRWSDYNAEPHHIDGGLAHVQERLIGYAALDAGYDLLQVMTPQNAAQNYARLEYKYQALAGSLTSPSIVDQRAELARLTTTPRRAVHGRLARAYRGLLSRFPAAGTLLRPLARGISRMLVPRGGPT